MTKLILDGVVCYCFSYQLLELLCMLCTINVVLQLFLFISSQFLGHTAAWQYKFLDNYLFVLATHKYYNTIEWWQQCWTKNTVANCIDRDRGQVSLVINYQWYMNMRNQLATVFSKVKIAPPMTTAIKMTIFTHCNGNVRNGYYIGGGK